MFKLVNQNRLESEYFYNQQHGSNSIVYDFRRKSNLTEDSFPIELDHYRYQFGSDTPSPIGQTTLSTIYNVPIGTQHNPMAMEENCVIIHNDQISDIDVPDNPNNSKMITKLTNVDHNNIDESTLSLDSVANHSFTAMKAPMKLSIPSLLVTKTADTPSLYHPHHPSRPNHPVLGNQTVQDCLHSSCTTATTTTNPATTVPSRQHLFGPNSSHTSRLQHSQFPTSSIPTLYSNSSNWLLNAPSAGGRPSLKALSNQIVPLGLANQSRMLTSHSRSNSFDLIQQQLSRQHRYSNSIVSNNSFYNTMSLSSLVPSHLHHQQLHGAQQSQQQLQQGHQLSCSSPQTTRPSSPSAMMFSPNGDSNDSSLIDRDPKHSLSNGSINNNNNNSLASNGNAILNNNNNNSINYVPILISTKDLEAAFFGDPPPTYNPLGGSPNLAGDQPSSLKKSHSKTPTIQRTKSFQERIQRVLWQSTNDKQSIDCAGTGRMKHPIGTRLSILGKPLPITRRKEIWFNSERVWVYNFLQRPKGLMAASYHLLVALLIITALTLAVLSTVHDLHQSSIQALTIIDLIILCLVTLEFLIRLWSSSCIYKYQGWKGKVRFLCATFRLIDMIVIAASATVVWADWVDKTIAAEHIYWLRFVQVFQALRLENRFKPWRIMGSVIWAQREHLTICTYMAFLVLIIISFGVYYMERDMPGTKFTSIAASIWWSIVTLYTIGYGDMTPETTAGKVLASCLILVGVSIFALPAGVLGTGLALKVQEEHRQKHIHKRILPAARIIQIAWRCYAASENSTSIATWKPCLTTRLRERSETSFPSHKSSRHSSDDRTHSDEHPDEHHQVNGNKKLTNSNGFTSTKFYSDRFGAAGDGIKKRLVRRNSITDSSRDVRENDHQVTINFSNKSQQLQSQEPTLTPTQKNAIRFIRKLRFLVAIKQFKNAFRPYDINDVLDQYSAGHADVIGRVRCMQSQINTVQFGLAKTMKMVQSLQYNQNVQISRLESVIGELTDRVISLQFSNYRADRGPGVDCSGVALDSEDDIAPGDSENLCPSYPDYYRRFMAESGTDSADNLHTRSSQNHHDNHHLDSVAMRMPTPSFSVDSIATFRSAETESGQSLTSRRRRNSS